MEFVQILSRNREADVDFGDSPCSHLSGVLMTSPQPFDIHSIDRSY